MATIGYGYPMTNIRYLASDYARSLGKTFKSKDNEDYSVSTVWFYAFMQRHPDLKNVRPQKAWVGNSKGSLQEKLDKYLKKLGDVLS